MGSTAFCAPFPEADTKGIHVYFSMVHTKQRKHMQQQFLTAIPPTRKNCLNVRKSIFIAF